MELVDNLKRSERYMSSSGSVSMTQGDDGSSGISVKNNQGRYSTGCVAPRWWFQNFAPIWWPVVEWIRHREHISLAEFRLMTSHVSGLTAVEQAIVVSAFIAYKNVPY